MKERDGSSTASGVRIRETSCFAIDSRGREEETPPLAENYCLLFFLYCWCCHIFSSFPRLESSSFSFDTSLSLNNFCQRLEMQAKQGSLRFSWTSSPSSLFLILITFLFFSHASLGNEMNHTEIFVSRDERLEKERRMLRRQGFSLLDENDEEGEEWGRQDEMKEAIKKPACVFIHYEKENREKIKRKRHQKSNQK